MKQLTILFLVRDNQVLLAMKKRGFGQGRWNGVGGKVETGESLEEAAKRECYEEILVTPLNYQKVAEILFDEMHMEKRDRLQVHIFLCNKWQGTPQETDEMAPKWFKKDELPYNDMWSDDPHWLPRVLAGKKLRCEFKLGKDDKLLSKAIKEVDKF